MRQAKRLRFPGRPCVIVLYHPAQYVLARALCAHYEGAELWYLRSHPAALHGDRGLGTGELRELDELARRRATETRLVAGDADARAVNEPLRDRLRELDVINPHAFIPQGRWRS